MAWLYGFGLLVLAGAIGYLYYHPNLPGRTGEASALQAVNGRLDALEAKVGQIEQRPAPSPVDLGPLTARVDALEKRTSGDTAPLAARVSALEQKVGEQSTTSGDGESQIADRINALAGRIDALSTKQQDSNAELARRLDTEAAHLDKIQNSADSRGEAIDKATAKVSGLADQADRVARVQAASVALDAGKPLGDIPGAPPALARYANTAPPTVASLRLSYPAAERAALAVSSPEVENKPFLDRVLARAQELVTIRQGDRVVVGDQSAGILARARTAILAGDVQGAVKAVESLHGKVADAMSDWLSQAHALLAARAALSDMTAHG